MPPSNDKSLVVDILTGVAAELDIPTHVYEDAAARVNEFETSGHGI